MRAAEADIVARAQSLFDRAPFVRLLGIEVDAVGEGFCETRLELRPELAQQDGYVHAGALATLADHTAGAAALTRVRAEQTVLSIEFKINLLRPAVGERLRCRAEVLKHGRTISVVEASVFATRADGETLVSKATITLAVVEKPEPEQS